MLSLNRREFLALSAQATASLAVGAGPEKSRLGLVHSTHSRLARPASPEDALDYARIRDMVWKAIEYGKPRAGSLEAKIKPGSWVVVKPNIVFLRPQQGYSTGDVTDWRVTRAVVEYVAQKSRAARITVAEGGSYRGIRDPGSDDYVTQNGTRVDATNFDWGSEDYPGFRGSLNDMLAGFRKAFPGKHFDYIDLTQDIVRDASGAPRLVAVPTTPAGVGAFAPKSEYYVTNAVVKSDFLITVPVAKVHEQCGVTGCFKNYVGTAPRGVYAGAGGFWNQFLHRDYSLDGRIDPFIADLAAFHPPDYCVVSAIRGHQYKEHYIDRPDQIIRNNLILAGEDPVAADTVIARLLGFNPWDIDYLHLASRRGLGTMDLRGIDLVGDEADRYQRSWGKPGRWYGRCNREWRVTAKPQSDMGAWPRISSATDTLDFAAITGVTGPDATYSAAVRVHSDGHRKAFLWAGARGRFSAMLNGEKVMEAEARTRYRIGQYQQAVELRPGENLLVFQMQPIGVEARLSALLVNTRNDGDTVEGIRWEA
jgi:uncharacterized protein (DUF362 family)